MKGKPVRVTPPAFLLSLARTVFDTLIGALAGDPAGNLAGSKGLPGSRPTDIAR